MKSKALLLLIIFLLNTAVGLGCALHMDMQSHHHHQDKSCCKATVNILVTQAKVIPETHKVLPQSPAILDNFQHDFYTVSLEIPQANSQPNTNHHHPPIPDIRIAVQSFQI